MDCGCYMSNVCALQTGNKERRSRERKAKAILCACFSLLVRNLIDLKGGKKPISLTEMCRLWRLKHTHAPGAVGPGRGGHVARPPPVGIRQRMG